MKARLFLSTLLICLPLLAGCSDTRPRYDDVRAEAIEALTEVEALIPGTTTPRPRPEQEPFGCGGDPLSGAGSDSAFYTGYWEVEVSDDLDVPGFIDKLPSSLGKGWETEDLGIPVPFAQVHLLKKSPKLSLTVEERERNGKKGIDLLVMSRCGVVEPTPIAFSTGAVKSDQSPRTNSPTTSPSPAPTSSAGARFPFTANE